MTATFYHRYVALALNYMQPQIVCWPPPQPPAVDVPFGKRKKLIRDDTATCDDILLQTLGMESSFFNKIRKTHSSVNNDSEVFCERFNRDKLPKFLSLSSPSGGGGGSVPVSTHLNRNRNFTSSHRKNAKRKLNQILQLLSKEISSTQKSRAGILPETAVRNIMRSLESQPSLKNGGSTVDINGSGIGVAALGGGENANSNLYLISKVETGSKLNLDSLRQFGLVSQSICDGIGSRVVDIGSTGTIEPFAVMNNKVSPHSQLLSLQKSPSHILSNFNFKTEARIAGAFESTTKIRENGRLDSSATSLAPLFLNGKNLNGNVTTLDHALNGVDASQKSPESPRAEVIVSNCNFKCNNQVSNMPMTAMNGCSENGKLYKIVSSLAASSPPTSKFCPKKKFITELTNGKSTFSFGVNSLDMLPSHVNSQTSLVGKNGMTLSSKNDIIT